MSGRLKISITATFAVLMLFCEGALGQNNPYKITDSLYKIYRRAAFMRYSPKGLLIADTLMQEAIRLDDKKAQCLALTIPVNYYFNLSDKSEAGINRMHEATERLKKKAKETGYEQYHYYAESSYVNYLLNANKPGRALPYAQAVIAEAKRTNSKYGTFVGYRMIGNIYVSRNENRLAVQNFEDAYNYAKENVQTEDLAPICTSIARAYMWLKDYDKTYEYSTLALKISKTRQSKVRAQTTMCMAYFYQGRYDDFFKLYNEIVSAGDVEYTKNQYWPAVQMIYYLINGQYQKADSMNAINPLMTRMFFGSVLEDYKGNYKGALGYIKKYHQMIDSGNLRISAGDLLVQRTDINRHVLDALSRKLQIENDRLTLRKLKLDVDAANNEADAVRLKAEANQIKLEQRTLETKMKASELEKVKAERKRHAISERNDYNLRQIIIGTSGVLAAFFLIYLIRYIRKERQLAATNSLLVETNDELVSARNDAEDADRMKTLFLQNMSHEVRTPLNAIVGFSQILAESGEDFDEEEKADFAMRIEENSDLVERMINDILMLTSIESGHYQPQVKSIQVNRMCRETIESVKEHFPTKLDIRFTTDVDDDFRIMSDKTKIQDVIDNLLVNSIKNTKSGYVQLDCCTKKTPGTVVLSVTDTGTGIRATEAEKIFERFYKVDDFKQGVGLGLSICEAIAERLNGKIYVDTSYTGGARMVFEIPTTG